VRQLLGLMDQSPINLATKSALRRMDIEKFGVSQKSFDGGWILAIEESGNRSWHLSLPRE